ncbi:MAG: hypothetical protein CMO66_01115 [Verrucomicrobiales bacterium]|mgnify:CR=1 FL=1|nr:hypothetical protein [Verrucomicrobiales bacterium]
MAHATFKIGDLTALIGDNSAHEPSGGHRAGYNGVWDFRHRQSSRSIFVPRYAGLNLEHIFNGETEFQDRDTFFEPRRAPMTFRKLNDQQAQLHQPATPHLHVESTTTFTLRPPWYLDIEFRCTPHQHVHRRGWFGCFWASYINAPTDKSLYFIGGWRPKEDLWMQFCTQAHDDESTVIAHDDTFKLTWKEGTRDALFKNFSPMRFARPLYYGRFEGLTYILMFKPAAGIRFTHSPSGGGVNQEHNTSNPAWDWQFIVPKYEVMREYKYQARAILRPHCSREAILEEYEKWADQ